MNTRMHRHQRGIATVIVVMLLITGVLVLLAQTSGIIRSRGSDTAQDVDSKTALLLAETGLQRAQAIITKAQLEGSMSADTCGSGGVASPSSFSLTSGSVTYGNSTALPAGCTSSQCTSCQVQVTGKAGNASRTLNATFTLGTAFGVAGNGTTVTMVLSNTFSAPTMALFELGWRRQGQGGNTSGTSTSPSISSGGPGTLEWNLESSQGNPSVGAIGTAMPIPANTSSPVVKQVLSAARDFVEVGGLYPAKSNAGNPIAISTSITGSSGASSISVGSASGLDVGMTVSGTGIGSGALISAISGTTVYLSVPNSGAVSGNGSFNYNYPLLLGSYYGNSNQHPETAFSNNTTTGSMLDGVDASDGTTCEIGATATPVPNPGPQGGAYQKCRTWCLDRTSTATKADPGKADTLVFGVSARSSSVANILNSVSFNTAGSSGTYNFPAQNISLNKLVHFPNTDGSTSTASGSVYSEEWYYYNLPYSSSSVSGFGASAYSAVVLGSAGQGTVTLSATAGKISGGATSFSVAAVNGLICIGDTINLVAGATDNKLTGLSVSQTPAGAGVRCSNSPGTYTLATAAPNGNNNSGNSVSMTFKSATFFPSSSLNSNTLATGAAVGGTTVSGAQASVTVGATSYNYYPLTAPITGTNLLAYSGQTPETATVNGVSQTVYRIYVPPGTPLPQNPFTAPVQGVSTQFDTILQVYKPVLSGGVVVPLQAGAKVVAVDPTTSSFTVLNKNASGTAVAPGFVGVQVCGGICALFNDPGNLNGSAATTSFSVSKSSGTSQWSSGFMCMSGVYGPNIVPVQSSIIKDRRWWESVQ